MKGKLLLPFLLAGLPSLASAAVAAGHSEGDLASRMLLLMLQLSAILVGSRLGGLLVSRYLRQPRVFGELLAGMLVGPYALGAYALPLLNTPLFPINPDTPLPVSPELYGLATLASVILLFVVGLETDLNRFMRYSVTGTLVGLGGVALSFCLGCLVTVLFLPQVHSLMDPVALFMGTLSTATSVGITARILSERHKTSSPEGVTILAGAVFDDVLCIILLAVVVGIARMRNLGQSMDWVAIGLVVVKAFGFWIVCTALGLLCARRLVHGLKRLHSNEAAVGITVGLALLLAGLAEMSGLAMIIGAYVTGLALSRTDLLYEIRERLEGVYQLLVPVFFCVMGMLVNLRAMRGILAFAVIFTLAAMVGKILGCAVPALLRGFNLRGAWRIGAGMLPRGEVTLLVAGIGLSTGVIGNDLFGVAFFTLLASAIIAPCLFARSLEGGSGLRPSHQAAADIVPERRLELALPGMAVADFLRFRLEQAFRQEEFMVHRISREAPVYQIRKENIVITMQQEQQQLVLSTSAAHEAVMRLIVMEEIVALKDMLAGLQELQTSANFGNNILAGLFGAPVA